MKLISLRSAFYAFFLISLASCSPKFLLEQNGVQFEVSENPVTLRANKVDFQANIKVKSNLFKPKGVAILRILQKGKKDIIEKDRLVLVGEKVKNINGQKIGDKEYFSGLLSFSENYDSTSNPTELWLEVISFSASKSNLELFKDLISQKADAKIPPAAYVFKLKIADGTSLITRMLDHQYEPIALKANFTPDTVKPFVATIYFELNRSIIRESELKRQEILELANYLSKQKEILKIEVNGYASPDGELQFNNELANERARAAGIFVMDALRSSKGLQEIKYDLNNRKLYVQNQGTEDWKGLLKGIEFARIPRKQEVIDIIQAPLESTEKQNRLRSMTESWEAISEDYLPPLRRANMIINTKFTPRNQNERLELIRVNSQEISLEEFLLTAELCKDPELKANLYEKIKLLYPADPRSYNNLALMELAAGRKESALRNLEAALEASVSNPGVTQNLAWIYYLTNNWTKLNALVKRNLNRNSDLSEYQAMIQIREGNYSDAIASLKNRPPHFLLALAQFMNRQVEDASKTLNSMAYSNSKSMYLSAVIAARQGNNAQLEKSLKALILKYPETKTRLLSDPEFAAFRREEYFKGIIQ